MSTTLILLIDIINIIFLQNINGSRQWAENRNGEFTANALLNTAEVSSTLCRMTEFTSLTEINCENVIKPPVNYYLLNNY